LWGCCLGYHSVCLPVHAWCRRAFAVLCVRATRAALDSVIARSCAFSALSLGFHVVALWLVRLLARCSFLRFFVSVSGPRFVFSRWLLLFFMLLSVLFASVVAALWPACLLALFLCLSFSSLAWGFVPLVSHLSRLFVILRCGPSCRGSRAALLVVSPRSPSCY